MLNLTIHSQDQVYEILVNELDSISTLLPNGNNDDSVEIRYMSQKGQVYLPSFSFKFYGITNNSVIHIEKRLKDKTHEIPTFISNKYRTPRDLLNPETRKKAFSKYFGFAPDREIMQNIVDEITDPLLRLENNRIKDNHFLTFEGNAKLMRLLTNRFKQFANQEQTTKHSFTCFELQPTSQDRPSTEALPILWMSTEKVEN